jgi:hypothetical protein
MFSFGKTTAFLHKKGDKYEENVQNYSMDSGIGNAFMSAWLPIADKL